MGFRAEVREFIANQVAKDDQEHMYKKIIALYVSEVDSLRKTNKDLMDRLMARNFEELKVYQTDEEPGKVNLTADDLAPDQDEDNAGKVIDG